MWIGLELKLARLLRRENDATRLEHLFQLVNRPNDLSLETWLNLAALVREFRPTFVLELGRGYGNSTAVFTELANQFSYRVVSVGYDSERAWETVTAPKLRAQVRRRWFRPLTVIQGDITSTSFDVLLAGEQRPFVFWDAHGEEVANAVLSEIFPLLPDSNRVVVHDVFDTRLEPRALDLPHRGGPYASEFVEIERIWAYLSEHGMPAETRRYGLLAFQTAREETSLGRSRDAV